MLEPAGLVQGAIMYRTAALATPFSALEAGGRRWRWTGGCFRGMARDCTVIPRLFYSLWDASMSRAGFP